MKKILSIIAVISCSALSLQAKNGQKPNVPNPSVVSKNLEGVKFTLLYQAFESHDASGTDIDTVKNQGDFIYFSGNGLAYMKYNGAEDSIGYRLIGKDSLSFGDTPFRINTYGNGYITLYQNEEETNGDYNRVTYLLKREEDAPTVSKR